MQKGIIGRIHHPVIMKVKGVDVTSQRERPVIGIQIQNRAT
jgi:hypothetical protein